MTQALGYDARNGDIKSTVGKRMKLSFATANACRSEARLGPPALSGAYLKQTRPEFILKTGGGEKNHAVPPNDRQERAELPESKPVNGRQLLGHGSSGLQVKQRTTVRGGTCSPLPQDRHHDGVLSVPTAARSRVQTNRLGESAQFMRKKLGS